MVTGNIWTKSTVGTHGKSITIKDKSPFILIHLSFLSTFGNFQGLINLHFRLVVERTNATCREEEFSCHEKPFCVELSWVCDGEKVTR